MGEYQIWSAFLGEGGRAARGELRGAERAKESGALLTLEILVTLVDGVVGEVRRKRRRIGFERLRTKTRKTILKQIAAQRLAACDEDVDAPIKLARSRITGKQERPRNIALNCEACVNRNVLGSSHEENAFACSPRDGKQVSELVQTQSFQRAHLGRNCWAWQ